MAGQEWTFDDLKRFFRRTMLGLLALAAFVYAGDWAVWKARVANGNGMKTVTVSRFVVAPLKGGKEEYYYDGTAETECSRSIFPQGGGGACWRVERNPVVFVR